MGSRVEGLRVSGWGVEGGGGLAVEDFRVWGLGFGLRASGSGGFGVWVEGSRSLGCSRLSVYGYHGLYPRYDKLISIR